MVQLEKPKMLIIGNGEVHSVKDFANEAFSYVGQDVDSYFKSSDGLLRPAQNSVLMAGITRANNLIGFKPQTKCNDLVKIMIDFDLEDVQVAAKQTKRFSKATM